MVWYDMIVHSLVVTNGKLSFTTRIDMIIIDCMQWSGAAGNYMEIICDYIWFSTVNLCKFHIYIYICIIHT